MARQTNLARAHKSAAPQKRHTNIKIVKKNQRVRKTRFLVAKVALCVGIFFAGIIGVIMSQVAITEVTMNITESSRKLEILESDYRTLTAELESSVALNNIESTVTREKGMSKLRDDQVIYVNLSDGDSVDVVESSSTSFLEKLKETFLSVMEYLKPEKNTMK